MRDRSVEVILLAVHQRFHLIDAPTLFPFLKYFPRLAEVLAWKTFYLLALCMNYSDCSLYYARTEKIFPFGSTVIILFGLVVEYAPHRISEATIMKYLFTDISLTKLADYIQNNQDNMDQFFQAHPVFYMFFLERVSANLIDQFSDSLTKTFDLYPYYKILLTYIIRRTIDPFCAVLENKHFYLPPEMMFEITSFAFDLPFGAPVYDHSLATLIYEACQELVKERYRKQLEKRVPSARLLTQQHRFFDSLCAKTREDKSPDQQEAFDRRWGLVTFQK